MNDSKRDFQGADWDRRMIYALKQLKRHPVFVCPDCGFITKTQTRPDTITCGQCGFVVDIPHAKAVWLSGKSLLPTN